MRSIRYRRGTKKYRHSVKTGVSVGQFTAGGGTYISHWRLYRGKVQLIGNFEFLSRGVSL